tara:strand:+ start:8184 stop:10466 length:2283 start_codon:yes stop_codon:yes gene_type:complete
MASIFDYYGSMRKGMKDREKEVEATILARQDAMYKHLERFPTLDDDSINAYGKQFGINDSFLKSVKQKRDQNVFEQEEQNKQLIQKTASGDLDIISKEIANDQSALNFKFSEETFDNKVALSDLDVKAKEVNLDQSLLNLQESDFDFGEKRKQSALVFRKLQLDVEGKAISNEQAKETLLQNKELFPYELQKTIQQLEKGEIEIDQALQTLTQDALLFDHTLESKRLGNIKSKEDIINQYREYNYNATEEEVKEFLKILDVNPSRALDIVAYHKVKKDKEDQEIFLQTLNTQKEQADVIGQLYQDALKSNGYNHQKAVDSVINSIALRNNEDLNKAAELELQKYNQTEANKFKAKESLTFISEYIPAGTSMARAKEIMTTLNIDPELQAIVLQDVKNTLQSEFIKAASTNRGISEVFLSGNEAQTLDVLKGYGFDVDNMTKLEIDQLKNIIFESNMYVDMKDKSVIESAGNVLTNNTKDMQNFITAISGSYDADAIAALHMMVENYYLTTEDIGMIVEQLSTIRGTGLEKYNTWKQEHGNKFKTQQQFKNEYIQSLTQQNTPMYLDESNQLRTSGESDDAITTEAGLSAMNNYLNEKVDFIVNGTDSPIEKTNALIKLKERLISDLELMQKNIQENTTDPDSDKEFELVLNQVEIVERVIENSVESLQGDVAEEKKQNAQTATNTETFKWFNENITSIIDEIDSTQGILSEKKRLKGKIKAEIKRLNELNGTNVTYDAVVESLKSAGLYPEFGSYGKFAD